MHDNRFGQLKRRALPAMNTLIDWSFGVLMPLSAVFQLYHGNQRKTPLWMQNKNKITNSSDTCNYFFTCLIALLTNSVKLMLLFFHFSEGLTKKRILRLRLHPRRTRRTCARRRTWHLFIYLFIYLFNYLFIYNCTYKLFIYLFIYL